MDPPIPRLDEQDRQDEEREPHNDGTPSVLLSDEQAQVPHANPPSHEDRPSQGFVLPDYYVANEKEEEQELDHGRFRTGGAIGAAGDQGHVEEPVDGGQRQ